MFAFSITAKLLLIYFCFKYGDTGRVSRPWILGLLLGLVFAIFDLMSSSWSLHDKFILGAAYLFCAIVIMNIYFRTHNIVLSLAVIASGTALLFFGIPFGFAHWLGK